MNDSSNVRLVDYHSERDRRHDDSSFSVDEIVLNLFTFVGFHPCVIECDVVREPFRFEISDEVFRLTMSRNVDDRRSTFTERFEEWNEDTNFVFLFRNGLNDKLKVAAISSG